MNTLLISYDLRNPDRDYPKLESAIKEAGVYARPLKSVWLIMTPQNAAYWRDKLRNTIDTNDGLMVITITHAWWATTGINRDITDWMQAHV